MTMHNVKYETATLFEQLTYSTFNLKRFLKTPDEISRI